MRLYVVVLYLGMRMCIVSLALSLSLCLCVYVYGSMACITDAPLAKTINHNQPQPIIHRKMGTKELTMTYHPSRNVKNHFTEKVDSSSIRLSCCGWR
jgi:hypothetical protein